MHLANRGKTLSQFSIMHSRKDLKQPTVTAEGKRKNVLWHFLNKHKSSSSKAIKLFGGNINTGLFLNHYNPWIKPNLHFLLQFCLYNAPDSGSSWGRVTSPGSRLDFYSSNIRDKAFIFFLLVERSYIISTFFSPLLSLQRHPFSWG